VDGSGDVDLQIVEAEQTKDRDNDQGTNPVRGNPTADIDSARISPAAK
jgi:hypothetical protein